MHKLTIFTVILSIVVVVIVADVLFNNYLSDVDEGKVSILTSQSVHSTLLDEESVDPGETQESVSRDSISIEDRDLQQLLDEDLEAFAGDEVDLDELIGDEADIDIEILELEALTMDNNSIAEAGFPGAKLVPTSFDGNIFQTIDVSDLNLQIKKDYIANNNEVFGAIYSFSVDVSRQNELYRVLRERGAFGSAVEVNETNTFGDNSFYMNDTRRESTAFLVIRYGNHFYGFAYPKKNHQYFKLLALNL